MDYSPFNPVIWMIMTGFAAVTYMAVKIFHARYPNYPNDVSEKRFDIRGKEQGNEAVGMDSNSLLPVQGGVRHYRTSGGRSTERNQR